MTLLLGATLAVGMVLVASPWLWPAANKAEQSAERGRIARLIQEAGHPALSTRAVIAAMVAAAVMASAVVWLATQIATLALLAFLVAGYSPIAYLRARRMKLRRQRRALWPDICELLIASLRVGMSLPDAVSSLGESASPMVRPAFAAFARDLQTSGRFEHSLDRLKPTLADPVADRIVETLRMARQVGGTELTSVLRSLAQSVRSDAAVRAEVEARQSWIRGAAAIGVVAPWVILGMLVTRPEGAMAYSTAEGLIVILVGAAVSVVAYRLMVKVGRLAEPRRWFA
jgi:tight adherence protein B